jgi:hypothetical protein
MKPIVLALAASSLALAACGQSPQNQMADAVEDRAVADADMVRAEGEMAAESWEQQADATVSDLRTDQLEAQAEAEREAAEARAQAIEDAGEARADSIRDNS